MRPLDLWPTAARRDLVGVFTDIDDTLTTEGAITPDALAALHRLRSAGLPVFAITGRPAGWSEAFALAWPVNAIVAENGAVALAWFVFRLWVAPKRDPAFEGQTEAANP